MKHYIILILLVMLVYANSLQNSFVWDDTAIIVDNPKINLPLKEILSPFTEPLWKLAGKTEARQVYYRPLVYLFCVLNYKVWGLNPLGFHLTDIMLHLIITIVLYRTGLLLFNKPPSSTDKPTRYDIKLISLMAASIFAVHPVHNEPVGRAASGEVIFGFFIILSLYFFFKEKQYLSWFAFFLALFSKETAVMLPFALITPAIHKRGFKRGIVAIIPYLALVGVYLILRMKVADTVLGDIGPRPIFTQIFTMAVATLDYIRLLVIPYPLSPFYPARWYTSILEPKVLIAILFLILILLLAFKLRKDKIMLFLLTFPFIMLAPVIWRVNTFPAGGDSLYIIERSLYVPAIPFSLLIVALAAKSNSKRIKKYAVSGWILIIIIFGFITASANIMWKDNLTLFTKIVQIAPGAAFTHNDLGIAYSKRGQIDKAIAEYKIALRLKPNNGKFHYNLGNAYFKNGNLNEAIEEYKAAIRLKPDDADAHYNIGTAYARQQRLDEAIQAYKTVAALEPGNIMLYNNIANLYMRLGRFDNAIEHYQIALRLKPDIAEIHNNLGLAYKQKGLINEAINEFRTALELQPDFLQARENLKK